MASQESSVGVIEQMSFLKRIFGPNHNEVWQQLSADLGAEFVKGSFFKGSSIVRATFKHWTVTLDTFTVSTGKSTTVYTRMSAPFINQDDFRFTIYRKGVFSSVGKFFGMQDVEVGGPKFENLEPLLGLPGYLDPQIVESGDAEFDADFIIKGTDDAKVKALFKQVKIRDLIRSQPALHLQIKHAKGRGKKDKHPKLDELYFQETGVIKDLERLKHLFALYEEVLKELSSLGTASKTRIPEGRS